MEKMSERYAETAMQAHYTLMAPIALLVKRLQDNPAYLDGLDPGELTRLAINSARALPFVYELERKARASLPLPQPGDEDGDTFEIEEWKPST
jgi:hypothetical protein